MSRFLVFLSAAAVLQAGQVWSVRVEEPTGLYARDAEAVRVPLSKLNGQRQGFAVVDDRGRELPWQVSGNDLLFPASLIPGQLPVFRVGCCTPSSTSPFTNPILLRRLGESRIEFGNPLFRAVLDLSTGAIVEAYTLRAGPQRMLNLVETTPEGPNALKGDVHETTPEAKTFSPAPVPGIDGQNTGWTTLGGSGALTKPEFLASGPLEARFRVERGGETWEISWTAGSPGFRWKAKRGFRFAAISASPYMPYDRCLDGGEYKWPTGPGESEPSPNDVSLRNWTKLPGGHMVYYKREENYGALGIIALDSNLDWKGAGTRRFTADRADAGATEIAVTFPEWHGSETVLEARKENRILRNPLLVQVSGPEEKSLAATFSASREIATNYDSRNPTPFQLDAVSLDGDWELAWSEKGQGPPDSGWRTIKVPGNVQTQWLPASQVYTKEAAWISEKEWWFRKKFQVPERFRGKRVRLEYGATDYYADTFLNGDFVGRHEGYIDPYEYDVEPRAGSENTLLVRVWAPVHYYWKHRSYTIKGAYGAVDQKPDDITPLGISRPLRLAAYEGALIRDVAVDTRLNGKAATVSVDLSAEGAVPGYQWELTLSPRNFQGGKSIQVRAAADANRLTLPVENAQLWWTRDHGKPNLYTLDVRLLDSNGRAVDGRSQAVGIREIERIGWNFYLNKRKMFVRGTNYYFHLYLGDMDRKKHERDMDLMLRMNINMIRVHCHYSNPEFYDLADEKGVLIWQDYLEAWYPHDTRFSLRAAELYDNHIRYVRNHPSIALWATSDEEDFENYRDLTKHLAPRAAFLDPQRRPVVRSTGRFGDSHVYHGWYDGTIWDYTDMSVPFVSELGATSLPNYETLMQFLPNSWPIREHVDEWMFRRLQIPEAMRNWGDPGDMALKDYIPRTQAYVSRLFQIALERQRRRKAEGAGGILHFHAIDIWPSVTMAAIDFNRVPTKVYDTVRRSFEPVAALFEYDRDRWKPGEPVRCGLWAVNDRWDAVQNATLRWRVEGPATNLPNGLSKVSLAADSVLKTGAAEFTLTKEGAYKLHAEILDAQGKPISENIFEFEVKR